MTFVNFESGVAEEVADASLLDLVGVINLSRAGGESRSPGTRVSVEALVSEGGTKCPAPAPSRAWATQGHSSIKYVLAMT